MPRKMRVFVPGPHWFIRPNNTDWRYTQMLRHLGSFSESLHIIPERSWTQLIDTNLRLLLGTAAARAHLRLPSRFSYTLAQYRGVSRRELQAAKPDVIFAYERFPQQTQFPVLWMTGPIPVHDFNKKEWERQNREQLAWKQECARRALQIMCSTTFAKNAFCSQTSVNPARVHVVPFLLPHLAGGGVPKTEAADGRKLRCLFVGRDAIRKGLPRALRILEKAPNWSLHVVSNFADGPVVLPAGVTHQTSCSQQEVLRWMSKSDVLFALSEFDSFGFAAVEAASRQCVPLFRAGSIQQSMFSSDAAAFLRDEWSPQECVAAIGDKLSAGARPVRDAVFSEFRANFSPESVAEAIHLLASTAPQKSEAFYERSVFEPSRAAAFLWPQRSPSPSSQI